MKHTNPDTVNDVFHLGFTLSLSNQKKRAEASKAILTTKNVNPVKVLGSIPIKFINMFYTSLLLN